MAPVRHHAPGPLAILLLTLAALAAWASVPAQAAPAAPRSPVERASVLVEQERFPEAERALRRILESRPGDTEAIYYLGRVYLETDRLSLAVDYMERMADRHEGSSRIHQGLGEAYAVAALEASVFRQLGLARDARSSLERAVRLDPRNLEARISLFEFYRHAPSVVGGGMDRARRQLEQIRRLDPARGHELSGHLLRDEGDEQGAIAAYRKALAVDPASARVRLSLVLALIETRRFGEAFEVIDGMLERDPDHMSALYQLGRNAALSGKRLDEGERALRRYLRERPLRSQPSHAWAHYRLGMIQKRQGELATARYSLRRALSMDPDLEGARKALSELDS
jgi:tetratricopeptide (TPR) repeat protein